VRSHELCRPRLKNGGYVERECSPAAPAERSPNVVKKPPIRDAATGDLAARHDHGTGSGQNCKDLGVDRIRRRGQATYSPQAERPTLVEYLFVDDVRLDSYVEQVAGPTTVDTVPTYGGTLSLRGPAISASTQREARPWTRHEKIELLLDFLRSNGTLRTHRPSKARREHDGFVIESCCGTRAVLPSSEATREFVLWLCEPPTHPTKAAGHRPSWLYPMQDVNSNDDRLRGAGMSSYSALRFLLGESWVDPDINQRLWDEAEPEPGPDDEVPRPSLAGLGPAYGPSGHEQCRAFAERPRELLRELGAEMGPSRGIRTLYRRRAGVFDPDSGGVVTFGYPIVIAADDGV